MDENVEKAVERFWSYVDVRSDDGCWEWQKTRAPNGYGRIYIGKKGYCASRWIYGVLHGPIPDEMQVCHRCDNRACVRPDHLFLGTRSDNMRDCASKGRNIMQRKPHLSSLHLKRCRSNVKGERHGNAKLNAQDVLAIRARLKSGERAALVASDFGISEPYARAIARRRSWAHLSENGQ